MVTGAIDQVTRDYPMLAWEQLAAAGQIEDAIVEYVRYFDWVTLVELRRRFDHYTETGGSYALQRDRLILWPGLSETFVDVLVSLLKAERVYLHPTSVLTYLVDGGLLNLPVARKLGHAYKTERWLPVCLRTVPPKASRNDGRGPGREVRT